MPVATMITAPIFEIFDVIVICLLLMDAGQCSSFQSSRFPGNYVAILVSRASPGFGSKKTEIILHPSDRH